jgi:hypothetical protein
VRLEELDQLKYPMTSSEIEPVTFRLVARVKLRPDHIYFRFEANKIEKECTNSEPNK